MREKTQHKLCVSTSEHYAETQLVSSVALCAALPDTAGVLHQQDLRSGGQVDRDLQRLCRTTLRQRPHRPSGFSAFRGCSFSLEGSLDCSAVAFPLKVALIVVL